MMSIAKSLTLWVALSSLLRASLTAEEFTTFVAEDAVGAFLATTEAEGGAELGLQWTSIEGPPNVGAWQQGLMGVGFGNTPSDRYDPWMNTDVRPLMNGITASLYVRIQFQVDSAETIDALRSLTLTMRCDDGVVAYLNGVEVQRFNAPHELNSESAATRTYSDAEAEIPHAFDISEHIDALVVGDNLLALHVLNSNRGNGDLLATAELVGSDAEPELRPSEGVLAITAIQWNPFVRRINRITARVVRGRVYELQSSNNLIDWRTLRQNSTLYVRDGIDPTPTVTTSVTNPDGPYLRVVER